MRWFLVFLLCLMGPHAWAAKQNIPVDRDDQGPNIPTVGSSTFDKIFSTLGALGKPQYDVPFPLERLVDKVVDMNGDFVHTMLPFSRSLQRPQNLSYDPILNPRIVITPIKDKSSLTRSRIFFGYVKARDQLEVISYNDEAGRFEFQIVTDYSSNPRVSYVNRGRCLSCHQSQAPIFSPPAWEDTAFGVMGNLISTKLGLERNDPENREIVTERLFGPIKSQDNVAMFDLLVREAGKISFDERLWLQGCGDDNKCRLGLLLKTLSPNSHYMNEYFAYSRSVIDRSSLGSQGAYSSFIRSTPLNVFDLMKKFGSIAKIVNDPAAISELIGALYNLAPADNPATPRPIALTQKDLAGTLAGFLTSDKDVLRNETKDQDQIAEILIHRYTSGDPELFSGAINKNSVMRAILSDAGSALAEDYNFWLTKPTPEKILYAGALPPVFKQKELNIFSRHCSSCHAVGSVYPPQFLLGNEEEVVANIGALKAKMLAKLENNLMPPNKVDRELLKSSGDYDLLVGYLKK
ncbi:MAG: hypothetical protein ACXWQO_04005 [Bdellovibrionota bacterium]